MIARAVWSTDDASLFHGDPHAGNLLWTDDGRLGILDWSLVGHITRRQAEEMSRIVLGALQLRAEPVRQAIVALAEGRVVLRRLQLVVDGALRRLRLGAWPSFTWLIELLDDATRQADAHFGRDLLLFRKVVHMLEGVLADITPGSSMDSRLIASFLRYLTGETSLRLLAPAHSRQFATHLSNAELIELALSGPTTASRWWQQTWADLLPRLTA